MRSFKVIFRIGTPLQNKEFWVELSASTCLQTFQFTHAVGRIATNSLPVCYFVLAKKGVSQTEFELACSLLTEHQSISNAFLCIISTGRSIDRFQMRKRCQVWDLQVAESPHFSFITYRKESDCEFAGASMTYPPSILTSAAVLIFAVKPRAQAHIFTYPVLPHKILGFYTKWR
jgi:hypothetical protein